MASSISIYVVSVAVLGSASLAVSAIPTILITNYLASKCATRTCFGKFSPRKKNWCKGK